MSMGKRSKTAIEVRKSCPEAEVLILGYTPPEYGQALADNNIIQGIVSSEYAYELAENTSDNIRCHIKIDTGMGRIGLKYDSPSECAEEIIRLSECEKLSVEGVYTHFAVADEGNDGSCGKGRLRRRGHPPSAV